MIEELYTTPNLSMHIARQLDYWGKRCYGDTPPSYASQGVVSNAMTLHKLLVSIEDDNSLCEAGMVEVELALGDIIGLCQSLCTKLGLDLTQIHFNGCQRLANNSKDRVEGDTSHDNDPRYLPVIKEA